VLGGLRTGRVLVLDGAVVCPLAGAVVCALGAVVCPPGWVVSDLGGSLLRVHDGWGLSADGAVLWVAGD
jgi:hypothetical protein